MQMHRLGKSWRLGAAALLSCVLIACGGGSGGVDAPSGNAQVGGGGSAGGGGGSAGTAPTIQGSPRSSIAVGQAYSFQPNATDPDGGTLEFSAQNLPSWLTLDPASGRISGTPTAADVGTYSGVVIEVSDGSSTARLGPFTISVTAMGSGAATVSWMPPTQNSDGSALTDLAGFVVVYGMSETRLDRSITIDNPSVTTYVVENLTSGRWYFAVHATNGQGVLSERSAIASKTIS